MAGRKGANGAIGPQVPVKRIAATLLRDLDVARAGDMQDYCRTTAGGRFPSLVVEHVLTVGHVCQGRILLSGLCLDASPGGRVGCHGLSSKLHTVLLAGSRHGSAVLLALLQLRSVHGGGVCALEADRAAGGALKLQDHLGDGGLAAAGLADKGQGGVRPHFEDL